MPENQETQPQGNQTKSASPNPQEPTRSGSTDSLRSAKNLWLVAEDVLVRQYEEQQREDDEKRERQGSTLAALEGRKLRQRAGSPTPDFFRQIWTRPERLDSEAPFGRELRSSAIARNPAAIRANRNWLDAEGSIKFASPTGSEESLAGSTRASQESSKSDPPNRAQRIAEQQEKLQQLDRKREGTSKEFDGQGL